IRIVDHIERTGGCQSLGKISGGLKRSWHSRQALDRAALAQSFVVEEEEKLVLADRPADRRSKLIELEETFDHTVAIVLPRIGIEMVVLQELVADSVEVVRPRFGDDVEDSASGAPEFRGVGRHIQAQFSDRFERNHAGGRRMKRAA